MVAIQVKNYVHPFSILIKDNDVLKLGFHTQKEFKSGYLELADMFEKHVPFDNFDSFFKKVQTGRNFFPESQQ